MSEPTTADVEVARHALQRGWVTLEQVRDAARWAWAAAQAQRPVSVTALLRPAWPPEATIPLERIYAALGGALPEAASVPDVPPPPPGAPGWAASFVAACAARREASTWDGGPSHPAEAPRGASRAEAVTACAAVWDDDASFAPHADVAFERRDSLGRGGMGEVWRVHDTRLDRDVALKRVRPDRITRVALRRFQREVRITARLIHPGVPPVYEAGTTARGEHYLAMRVIEGEPLARAIAALHEGGRGDSAARARLLEVLLKVAETVAYAHSQGVIHRDLKPENVMVGAFGQVMVLDWGLACEVGQDAEVDELLRQTQPPEVSRLTEDGVLLGTLGYMAPEQARGDARDPKVDVIALGAILCEILTGRVPLEGQTAINLVQATLTGAIVSPRTRDRRIDRALDALAVAATHPDAEQRLATAAAFAERLRAYLTSGPRSTARRLLPWVSVPCALAVGALGHALARPPAAPPPPVAAAPEVEGDASAWRRLEAQALLGGPAEVVVQAAEARVAEEGPAARWRAALAVREVAPERARRWLEEWVQEAPETFEARREGLIALHRVEQVGEEGWRWTDALSRLQALGIAEGARAPWVVLEEGTEALRAEAYERAEVLYTEALAGHPDLAWAYYNRGVARSRLDDLQGAEEDFSAALARMPRDVDALFARARLRASRSQHRLALRDLEWGTWVDPEASHLWFERGAVLGSLGRWEEAAESYGRVCALEPGDVEAWARQGEAWAAAGEWPEARRCYRTLETFTLSPEDRRGVEEALERVEARISGGEASPR